MRKFLLAAVAALALAPGLAFAQATGNNVPGVQQSASRADATTSVAISNTTALTVASQVTATATPTNGSVYVTGIIVGACNDATGAAVLPTVFTTTNLPSLPFIPWANASTVSTCFGPTTYMFASPLKASSPGVAVTVVSPASATHTAFYADILYYSAP